MILKILSFLFTWQLFSRIGTIVRTQQMSSILSRLRPTIATRALSDCIAILNAVTHYDVLDAVILNDLLERCASPTNHELSALSHGHLEALSRVLIAAHHCHEPDIVRAAGQAVLSEMKSRLGSIAYRRFFTHFIGVIRNLTALDVYDLEVMQNLFEPKLISFIYGKQLIDVQLHEIDGYNRINLKGIYDGPYLADDHLNRVRLLHTGNTVRPITHLIDAMKVATRRLFTHVCWGCVLPFHSYPGNLKDA